MSGTKNQSQIEEEISLELEEETPKSEKKIEHTEKRIPKYYECDDKYRCFEIPTNQDKVD